MTRRKMRKAVFRAAPSRCRKQRTGPPWQQRIARGSVPVNGIESFWSYAKRRMVQFNGVPSHTFYLHLKETEFRFNQRHSSLYKARLSLLRNNPL